MCSCYDSRRIITSVDHSHRFVPMSSLVPCHIRDIGLGKVMRVPGCSKLAHFTGSWRNFLYKFQKGLDGLHSDKSAANNCNLRQWRSPEPSCLPYIVLDDRFPVIDSNMRMQCHCATQIRTALLLQQRRWDRPLGTAHFANSDKSAANICKLRTVAQSATLMFGLHWEHAVSLTRTGTAWRSWCFKHIPLWSGLCIWLWYLWFWVCEF